MKVRRRPLVALLVCVALAAIVLCSDQPEPLYSGKSASVWVKEWLEQPDQTMHPDASEIHNLREIGPPAVECLIKTIQKRRFLYGSTAYSNVYSRLPAFASKRIPRPIQPQLVRIRAYWTLATLGALAKPALPVLVERLKHDDSLRSFATYTLSTLGTNAAGALPSLLPELNSASDKLVFAAAEAISGIDPDNHHVVARMQVELQSTNLLSRRNATRIISLPRPLSSSVEAALLGQLGDSDFWVRFWAAEGLLRASSTNREPLEVMLTIVHGPGFNISGAFYKLAQVRPTTADICTVLVEVFKRSEPQYSTRSYLHLYFEEFTAADSNAIPALVKATEQMNSAQLRRLAAQALERTQSTAKDGTHSNTSGSSRSTRRPVRPLHLAKEPLLNWK